MPRKEPLPPREQKICQRFAEFRRGTKIPRSVFARTVGFIPERLANYEMQRAPIRWDAFLAVHRHFLLSPVWLVTGEGKERLHEVFEFGGPRAGIGSRDLLSDVYDRVLKMSFHPDEGQIRELFFGADGVKDRLERVMAFLADPTRRSLTSGVLLTEIGTALDHYSLAMDEALRSDGTLEKAGLLSGIYGSAGVGKSLPTARGNKRKARPDLSFPPPSSP